jgi:hypothetical protein
MCPFCLTTLVIIVTGAATTGGIAALAVKASRKLQIREIIANSKERGNQHVDQHEREA